MTLSVGQINDDVSPRQASGGPLGSTSIRRPGEWVQLMPSRFSVPCTAQLSRFREGLLTLLAEVVGKVGEMNALCGLLAVCDANNR